MAEGLNKDGSITHNGKVVDHRRGPSHRTTNPPEPPKLVDKLRAGTLSRYTMYDAAHRIERLEDIILRAQNCLVCVAIGDPFEVIENTQEILSEKDSLEEGNYKKKET